MAVGSLLVRLLLPSQRKRNDRPQKAHSPSTPLSPPVLPPPKLVAADPTSPLPSAPAPAAAAPAAAPAAPASAAAVAAAASATPAPARILSVSVPDTSAVVLAGGPLGEIARRDSNSTCSSASTARTAATADAEDWLVASPASSVGAHLDGPGLWETLEGAGRRKVSLPDLFSSIMATVPAVCPNLEVVRPMSEEYIDRCWSFDEKARHKNHLLDVTFLVAMWVPHADEETLLTITNFTHWLFYFDDQFDEGHLTTDYEAAVAEVKRTLDRLEDGAPFCSAEEDPYGHVFQDSWHRFKKRAANKDLERRYIKSLYDYCDGVLQQVKILGSGMPITPEQYLDLRRVTGGIYPCYAMQEYCHGIDLPQHVIDHKSIAICEEVAIDITILHNEIMSYKKDLQNKFPFNLIIIYSQMYGLSEQQAIDRIDGLLADCFRRWYGALVELPTWGEKIDREVLRYLDICRNLALGSLQWSFESKRYLGEDGPAIRATRVMSLP